MNKNGQMNYAQARQHQYMVADKHGKIRTNVKATNETLALVAAEALDGRQIRHFAQNRHWTGERDYDLVLWKHDGQLGSECKDFSSLCSFKDSYFCWLK